MAIVQYMGGTPVATAELQEKIALGDIRLDSINKIKRNSQVHFSTGTVKSAKVLANFIEPGAPKYESIKIGKPLSVEILGGSSGSEQRFRNRKKLLISSKIKAPSEWGKATRMINILKSGVGPKDDLTPNADDTGGSVIYYSPAVTQSTISCSVQMTLDNFDESIFGTISDLLDSAGNFPVFAPISGFLLAGSKLVKLAGSWMNWLTEDDAFLKDSLSLRFLTPGVAADLPGLKMVCNDDDWQELQAYRPGVIKRGGDKIVTLVDRQNPRKQYQGSKPFLILEVDGRERENHKAFLPQVATAQMLEQFYGGKSDSVKPVEKLSEALSLYNDFAFLKKAQRAAKQKEEFKDDPKKLATAETLYNSYLNNIQSDRLRELL